MFLNALLARFAVLVPVSLGIYALTYLRWFKELWKYIGSGIDSFWSPFLYGSLDALVPRIAMASAGHPGTGMMICWMFLAMNVCIFDIHLSRFCDDCTGSNVRMCNLFSLGGCSSLNGSRLVRDTYPIYGNPFSVHIFFYHLLSYTLDD